MSSDEMFGGRRPPRPPAGEMTTRISPLLRVGGEYVLDGREIVFKAYEGEGQLYFETKLKRLRVRVDPHDPESDPLSVEYVVRAMAEGRFVGVSEIALAANGGPVIEADRERVLEIDPGAEFRKLVCERVDAHGRAPKPSDLTRIVMSVVNIYRKEFAAYGVRPPEPRTVQSWLKRCGSFGRRTYSACMSGQGRTERKSRLNPTVYELTVETVLEYYSDRTINLREGRDILKSKVVASRKSRETQGLDTAGIVTPSRETFRKYVKMFACYDTFVTRYGERAAARYFVAHGKGVVVNELLRLVAMDHTPLDCIVMDEFWGYPLGRPLLTVIIDMATRCILGHFISFEPPSIYSVMECLKIANRPKIGCWLSDRFPVLQDVYGKPLEIIVDNGREFIGSAFQHSMSDLGTSIRLAGRADPTFKQIVERFFGILNTTGVHKIPGSTYNSIARVLHEFEIDRSPVLTLSQLRENVGRAISLYHIEQHSTLKRPPAAVWAEQAEKYGIRCFEDPSIIDKMLGAVATRQLSRKGISIYGLRYSDKMIVEKFLSASGSSVKFTGKRIRDASVEVTVKFNPANLSEVHVWYDPEKMYLTLPCVAEDYSDCLSVYHHKLIGRWANANGLRFSSEGERVEARAAWREHLRSQSPEKVKEIARALGQLRSSPEVLQIASAGMPTGSGKFQVIFQEPAAATRSDGSEVIRKTRAKRKPKTSENAASSPKSNNRRGAANNTTEHVELTYRYFEPSVDAEDWRAFDDQ